MPYTQHPEEEQQILDTFGEFEGKALDIGAWQPKTFSNTRALFERGWSLVLAEPSPGPFIHLLLACSNCGTVPVESYGNRGTLGRTECDQCGWTVRYGSEKRITLILAAVARERQLLRLHATDDALTTSSDKEQARWGEAGGYYGRYYVPTITVEEVISQFGPFDFISVDCEGINQEVFFALPLQAMRPKAVIVEYSSLGERATMQNHAHKAGYVQPFATGENGGNLIFISAEWFRASKRKKA